MTQKYEVKKNLNCDLFTSSSIVCDRSKNNCFYLLNKVNFSHLPLSQHKQVIDCASTLQRLHHPNILKFHETFTCEQTIKSSKAGEKKSERKEYLLFIVLKWEKAESIGTEIEKRRKKKIFLSEVEILLIFLQLLIGLDYLHSKNVIHYNIRPDNVYLCGGGVVKYGPIGIVHQFHSDALHSINAAPELLNQFPYNQKTDVWFLGSVLFQLCTLSSLQLEKDQNIAWPSHTLQRYSTDLINLITSLLQTDIEQRPTSSQLLSSPSTRSLSQSCIMKFNLYNRPKYAHLVAAFSTLTPANHSTTNNNNNQSIIYGLSSSVTPEKTVAPKEGHKLHYKDVVQENKFALLHPSSDDCAKESNFLTTFSTAASEAPPPQTIEVTAEGHQLYVVTETKVTTLRKKAPKDIDGEQQQQCPETYRKYLDDDATTGVSCMKSPQSTFPIIDQSKPEELAKKVTTIVNRRKYVNGRLVQHSTEEVFQDEHQPRNACPESIIDIKKTPVHSPSQSSGSSIQSVHPIETQSPEDNNEISSMIRLGEVLTQQMQMLSGNIIDHRIEVFDSPCPLCGFRLNEHTGLSIPYHHILMDKRPRLQTTLPQSPDFLSLSSLKSFDSAYLSKIEMEMSESEIDQGALYSKEDAAAAAAATDAIPHNNARMTSNRSQGNRKSRKKTLKKSTSGLQRSSLNQQRPMTANQGVTDDEELNTKRNAEQILQVVENPVPEIVFGAVQAKPSEKEPDPIIIDISEVAPRSYEMHPSNPLKDMDVFGQGSPKAAACKAKCQVTIQSNQEEEDNTSGIQQSADTEKADTLAEVACNGSDSLRKWPTFWASDSYSPDDANEGSNAETSEKCCLEKDNVASSESYIVQISAMPAPGIRPVHLDKNAATLFRPEEGVPVENGSLKNNGDSSNSTLLLKKAISYSSPVLSSHRDRSASSNVVQQSEKNDDCLTVFDRRIPDQFCLSRSGSTDTATSNYDHSTSRSSFHVFDSSVLKRSKLLQTLQCEDRATKIGQSYQQIGHPSEHMNSTAERPNFSASLPQNSSSFSLNLSDRSTLPAVSYSQREKRLTATEIKVKQILQNESKTASPLKITSLKSTLRTPGIHEVLTSRGTLQPSRSTNKCNGIATRTGLNKKINGGSSVFLPQNATSRATFQSHTASTRQSIVASPTMVKKPPVSTTRRSSLSGGADQFYRQTRRANMNTLSPKTQQSVSYPFSRSGRSSASGSRMPPSARRVSPTVTAISPLMRKALSPVEESIGDFNPPFRSASVELPPKCLVAIENLESTAFSGKGCCSKELRHYYSGWRYTSHFSQLLKALDVDWLLNLSRGSGKHIDSHESSLATMRQSNNLMRMTLSKRSASADRPPMLMYRLQLPILVKNSGDISSLLTATSGSPDFSMQQHQPSSTRSVRQRESVVQSGLSPQGSPKLPTSEKCTSVATHRLGSVANTSQGLLSRQRGTPKAAKLSSASPANTTVLPVHTEAKQRKPFQSKSGVVEGTSAMQHATFSSNRSSIRPLSGQTIENVKLRQSNGQTLHTRIKSCLDTTAVLSDNKSNNSNKKVPQANRSLINTPATTTRPTVKNLRCLYRSVLKSKLEGLRKKAISALEEKDDLFEEIHSILIAAIDEEGSLNSNIIMALNAIGVTDEQIRMVSDFVKLEGSLNDKMMMVLPTTDPQIPIS